ncbi:MAG: sulfite reductase subunit alpha [Verrucomicrobia bacterium]|nr:sulfite reductase subunit alpha [Verrucomicrobiota bacterium]
MDVQVPYIPENAPFSPAQRAWLNGFLAGLFSQQSAAAQAPPKIRANVYFGTETGNSEALAKQTAKFLQSRGFESQAINLNKISSSALAGEAYALIVISTFGDGDPPDSAKAFYTELHTPDHPRLSELRYSILALGDRNYERFCQCGKDIDVRLEALGGHRIYGLAECDVDYEATAEAWKNGVATVLEAASPMQSAKTEAKSSPAPEPTPPVSNKSAVTGEIVYDRKHPFLAQVSANRLLTAPASAKETRHFEISLDGSNLSYSAGDALGIVPCNCPELVEQILKTLNCDGEEAVPSPDGTEVPLHKALLEFYEITKIPSGLLRFIAEHSADPALRQLLEPAAATQLKSFVSQREIVDLLVEHSSAKISASEFVSHLKKLGPRLYSIASSPAAHGDSVHLTISIVRYETNGRKRKGVCSTFLADRARQKVGTFVHRSPHFRLPEDYTKPVIMVGPGTGIAPFRGFLYEREAVNAAGHNWLFFGDQKESTDFLYQDELFRFKKNGLLTRFSTAFSRDQPEKIYVQQRMLENAAELWAWLEEGAHFYVCGDAQRMAKDVDAALHTIIEQAGQKSKEEAEAYIKKLKAEHRYQRDVY